MKAVANAPLGTCDAFTKHNMRLKEYSMLNAPLGELARRLLPKGRKNIVVTPHDVALLCINTSLLNNMKF